MKRNTARFAMVPFVLSWLISFSFDGRAQIDTDNSQAVVVITASWEATHGRLAAFSRSADGWIPWRNPVPVTVGHNGLGWGNGLHRKRKEGPMKREGDKRAPAGVFALEFGFGAADFRSSRFPYYRVDDRDRWVDDPKSHFYNQWTRIDDPRFPKDWNSAEVMRRPDGIYDHVIVVGHNREPILPGHGSAIFLHTWYGPGRSTIGCTAMKKSEVKRLLRFLDATARPILIQVPREEVQGLDLSAELRRAIHDALGRD